ncbi:MAG: monovalent cation/H+ antiporter complex subunit F [Micrococcales bacterium]|nr:monovalent cation/H+ antiporter complex subunit F [Micrococcales bacterium]
MTIVPVAGLVALAIAAALALIRLFRGPTNLDRIIALDVMLVILISGIAMDAAGRRTTTSLPLLLVLGLVSFIGGVAITRFMSHDSDREEGR